MTPISTAVEQYFVTGDLTSTRDIYFNFFSAQKLGITISAANNKKISEKLQDLLKKNDSLTNLADTFFVAAELENNGKFVLKHVKSTLAQTDEIDGKYLQFEGGLTITAAVISGLIKVTQAFNETSPITADQAEKFAAYLLARRSIRTPRGLYLVLETLEAISQLENVAPICIKKVANTEKESQTVLIQVSDLFGKLVNTNEAPTFSFDKNKNSQVEKLKKSSLAQTLYELDLSKFNLEGGYHDITIKLGTFQQSLQVPILNTVKVTLSELVISDGESNAVVKKIDLKPYASLQEQISVDNQQRITLKVTLADKVTNKLLSVHQVFLRFSEKTEEIIFVAEQDASKSYKFDIDIGAHGSNFGYRSGLYAAELLIGDFLISNPFVWKFGTVNLSFNKDLEQVVKEETHILPEIHHQFRQPEKRPPQVVSSLFTVLCLLPFLILFYIWYKIGLGISNLQISISALIFHICIGSVFGMYALFWYRLNIFETLKYMMPLGFCTFITGNYLLRNIAVRRLSKNDKM